MTSLSQEKLPQPIFKQKDKKIKILIWAISVIVFLVVASLSKAKLNAHLNFDPHIFATINAIINSIVALLLLAALLAVKSKKYFLHKKLMLTAIILSVLFLISYVSHHLLSGDTKYGDLNHDGILSMDEKTLAGSMRYVYYIILATHIPLAAIILPFILFTAYRALSADYIKHMKLARITWPVWFYVAISGVIVYLMIRPYYH
jgi:putative membrane protein